MKSFSTIFLVIITLISLCGCDNSGLISKPIVSENIVVVQNIVDNYTTPLGALPYNHQTAFARGEQTFLKIFTQEEGLGPVFNNTGCVSCHPSNGRGTPDLILIRFSIGDDLMLDMGGPQFQDKVIPDVPYEMLPIGVDKSPRLPPPVFGMGLIESIPVETILANADEDDADGDGISGRPHWVTAPDYVPVTEVGGGQGQQLGRFGRKASVSSLLQQVTQAFHQDIGITSGFLPIEHSSVGDKVSDPEIENTDVMNTVIFMRFIAPPPRGEITPEVKSGEILFSEIKCASCHVPTMQTGPSNIPAFDEVDVHIYSDLLLHDMGEELADNRPDGDANGREWRTAPLWGTRLVADFLGGTPFFLHDGRATTLQSAIRAHGGEAQKSKEAFFNLSESEQQAVIDFINSL